MWGRALSVSCLNVKIKKVLSEHIIMDLFNLSNLSTSMINQLNAGFSSVKKQNLHLQTGKRLIEPADRVFKEGVPPKEGSEDCKYSLY